MGAMSDMTSEPPGEDMGSMPTDQGSVDQGVVPGEDTSAPDDMREPVDDMADMGATEDPLAWPAGEGVWGTPTITFTLPKPEAGKGIYLPDVQESHPDVDWQALERLYIPAGHYPFIRLGNLPERSADNPLVITNKDGQVRIGGLDHHYLFVIGGGSNWVLTGRYDPVSQTGDENFPGHRGGAFANSQGTYGIVVDDEFVRESVSGIGIGGRATDFEVEYVEITRVGFAGMLVKTDDQGDAHMENVRLHDLYIHDVTSEGVYIGSTQSQPQHQIRGIQIFNNRILRTGTEAIQLGQLAGDSHVHHNVFGPAAIDWRDAFQNFQDGNLQIALRAGHLIIEDNIFMGAAGSMVGLFGLPIQGDDTSANVGVDIRRNHFIGTRNLGMYINNESLPNMSYTIADNTWSGWRFERDEVYADATPYNHLLRVFNSGTPIAFDDNTWEGPELMVNALPDEGNGQKDNISGMNNRKGSAAPVRFVERGLADDFDILNLEQWAANATRGDGSPVAYQNNEVVMYGGEAWRCKLDPCPGGRVPPEHADTWESLGMLADDVRVEPETEWEGRGLNPMFAR